MSLRYLNEAQKDVFNNTLPRFVNKDDFSAALHQVGTAKPPSPNPGGLTSLWYVYTNETARLKKEAAAAA
ncbi:hypothetical protein Q9L58_010554, partial [Maublancomyces gigas]